MLYLALEVVNGKMRDLVMIRSTVHPGRNS
jgi:hypothetical protein